ncbi:MBL fold metallo-hydrolase [Kribbella sp. NPDC005582]|uniref:MBL fold metallo-hydrolase n=1 Tax=Kribbella sp. NPDC005582 TaxID=3156893 RepID=UPI0033A1315B
MVEKLQHLSGRIWLYPHDPDPDAIRAAVALIVDDAGNVLVDAGNSLRHAREIQQAIAAAGLELPTTIVYTHHHWDHTWGAAAWGDVEIVAHASASELLTAEAARPWSHQYLRDQVAENPKLGPSFRARALAMPDWSDFAIRIPDRTFDDELSLRSGVQVRHVGGRHAPDSSVVVVPGSGVMLLGDCYFPPPFHLRSEDDGNDFGLAKRLLAEGHRWYVDAHSAPQEGPQLQAYLP